MTDYLEALRKAKQPEQIHELEEKVRGLELKVIELEDLIYRLDRRIGLLVS